MTTTTTTTTDIAPELHSPTDAHSPADFHSPADRLERYTEELGQRKAFRTLAILGVLVLDTIIACLVMKPDWSGWGVCTSLLILPALLLSTDLYGLVRDYAESRGYFPVRPHFPNCGPTEDFSVQRFSAYVCVAPILPIALLWVLQHFGQIQMESDMEAWQLGGMLSLATGMFGIFGLENSAVALIRLFKRVPSADVN